MYEIQDGLNLFFDCEFTGLHQTTTLMSMAFETDTGETFYAEFIDYNGSQVDDWIRENVVRNMEFDEPFQTCGFPDKVEVKNNRLHIKANLEHWFRMLLKKHDKSKVVIISDCLAYDWVLFCELWGGALKIPEIVYYIPVDISTLFLTNGIDPDIHRESYAGFNSGEIERKHSARWDAYIIRKCYEKLTG